AADRIRAFHVTGVQTCALPIFEVPPATVIGFLTIMGFGLYDAVVIFDKVHENTRGITASNTQTYGEAANLAVNQTLMRSINTSRSEERRGGTAGERRRRLCRAR